MNKPQNILHNARVRLARRARALIWEVDETLEGARPIHRVVDPHTGAVGMSAQLARITHIPPGDLMIWNAVTTDITLTAHTDHTLQLTRTVRDLHERVQWLALDRTQQEQLARHLAIAPEALFETLYTRLDGQLDALTQLRDMLYAAHIDHERGEQCL